MDELPEWVQEFNNLNLAEEYLTRVWDILLPEDQYTGSRPDDNPYEGWYAGMESPTFPIDLAYLVEEHGEGPGLLSRTPFSDELLLELAIAAIDGENLGKRGVPDILSVAFSATDAIGHRFGPASRQMQDQLIRLDRYIAQLLDYLDSELGIDNVLVFLTSDHGAVYIPHYLRNNRIITGNPDTETHIGNEIRNAVSEYLEEFYGQDILLSYSNQNFYLDHDYVYVYGNDLDIGKVRKDLKRFLLTLEPIAGAITADVLNSTEFNFGIRSRAQHIFHQKRSGDVIAWVTPQTRGNYGTGGTGHGTPWAYDTHVPLVFYGYNIPAGETSKRT